MSGEQYIFGIIGQFLGNDSFQPRLVDAGFSGAVVIRVESSMGTYALRGWPPRSHTLIQLFQIHETLRNWRRDGLPVAVPIPCKKTGKTIYDSGTRYWQMEPWLPGQPVRPGGISDLKIRSLMSTLAELHISARQANSKNASPEFGVRIGHPPAITHRRNLISKWNDNRMRDVREHLSTATNPFRQHCLAILDLFQTVRSLVDLELLRIELETVSLHPCWRDLWSDHVLFEGDEVSGLIDAGSAKTDHVSSDLSRILGSLLEDDFERWQFALELYRREVELKTADLALIQAMDRSSVLLSGLTWIERWENKKIPGEWYPQIEDRLARIEMRLRSLASRLL